MKDAVIIMARFPEARTCKTRLAPYMSENDRLTLYVELMESTIRKLSLTPGADVLIAHTPDESAAWFDRFSLGTFKQKGENLGERMHLAMAHAFSLGYERAVLVGTDIPDISPSIARAALDLLVGADLVIGPAEDGGYYLIGMKRAEPRLFEDIPWSSPRTLSATLDEAAELGLTVAMAKTLYDVDTVEGVRRYRAGGSGNQAKREAR